MPSYRQNDPNTYFKESKSMKNIVIVDGVRTPFGRLGGGLRQFHTADLGAIAIE